MIKIWHNSKYSKSRVAFNYLKDNKIDKLKEVLQKLIKNLSDIARKKESIFKESGLKNATKEELLNAMVKYLKLIERPIVINKDKVAITRVLLEIQKVI